MHRDDGRKAVLFVALDVAAGHGGMQRYCARVARALGETGGVRARTLALRDPRDRSGPVEGFGRRKRRMIVRFLRLLVRERPDAVIIGHVVLAPLVFVVRVLAPRAQVILLVYGIDAWHLPGILRRTAVRRVDDIVSISVLTAQRLTAAFGRVPRITIVPPAVDLDEMRTPRRARDGTRILSVARMDAHDRPKGVDAVLRALPRVLKAVPDARYDVVGDGVLRAELEDLARALGVSDHVTFHGRLDGPALDDLYEAADVFALPSTKEGFGIVYLEAWLRHVPVVAGRFDAGAEVVAHGQTGFVVDPSAIDEVATAIVALLEDQALREKLGSAGAALIADFYDHERFRDDISSLLTTAARAEVAL